MPPSVQSGEYYGGLDCFSSRLHPLLPDARPEVVFPDFQLRIIRHS